jgi:hypothetical protein
VSAADDRASAILAKLTKAYGAPLPLSCGVSFRQPYERASLSFGKGSAYVIWHEPNDGFDYAKVAARVRTACASETLSAPKAPAAPSRKAQRRCVLSGGTWGACGACENNDALVADVGLCGPCCFGEASTAGGNW